MRLTAVFLALCATSARAQWDRPGLDRLFDGSRQGRGVVTVPAPRSAPVLTVEARETLDALFAARPAATRAWPGYDMLSVPLLISLRDGTAVLAGAASAPPGFEPIDYHGQRVFVAARSPTVGFMFKRNFDLYGTKVTAVAASDERSGAALIQLAAHEHFHDHQHGWSFPHAGDDYDVEQAEDIALARQEGEALAHWLESGDIEAMKDFSALRRHRRALFPGTAAEESQENSEGMARYVDSASLEAADPSRRAKLIKDTRFAPRLEDMDKGRLYQIGAVLGRFLETRTPGAWQGRVAGGRSVSELALGLLPMDQAEEDARIARLTAGAAFAKDLAAGAADVKEYQDRRDRARAEFRNHPGLRVKLYTEKGTYFSDDKAWFREPDGTTLHEHMIEITGGGPSSAVSVKDRVVASGRRYFEFVVDRPVTVVVDGAPWDGRPGRLGYRELVLTGAGVDIRVTDGGLDYDGSILKVWPVHPVD